MIGCYFPVLSKQSRQPPDSCSPRQTSSSIPSSPPPAIVEPDSQQDCTINPRHSSEDLFGPWMLVKKQARRTQSRVSPNVPKGPSNIAKTGSGSRFDILDPSHIEHSVAAQEAPAGPKPTTMPQSPKALAPVKPLISKVRNSSGGKNPQKGPLSKKEKKPPKTQPMPRIASAPLKAISPSPSLVQPLPPIAASPSSKVDKAEERASFALMNQIGKQQQESHQNMKAYSAILHDAVVLPDEETMNFLSNKQLNLGRHSSSREPPDPGPQVLASHNTTPGQVVNNVESMQAPSTVKKFDFNSHHLVHSSGHSGGLWCLWDSHDWQVDVLVGFVGYPFTWRRGNLAERLDRVLINLDWRLRFQQASVYHLPFLKSDHVPLWLCFKESPRPN
ncbi:Endonuclease/exonuclease/phosphatase superfamily [Sesbania bispinosa]|nr:Endonuclease/exonuclease/phosphatase superfamily [Sesbania bispinosa]